MMPTSEARSEPSEAAAVRDQYLVTPRGERLRPGWAHPRRWHLLLLRRAIEELLASDDLAAGGRVLDYGCAERPYEALFRRRFGEYVGVDLPGNPQADVSMGADGRIPVADESADCLLSSQVLEHVPVPAAYLVEARRVIRRGGHLVLSTHGYWMYHPDPNDYWRWTREGLLLEISRAGFEIVRARSVFGFASSALQLWQDASAGFLPRPLRPLYYAVVQAAIGAIERWRPEPRSPNASVYLVLAKRT